MVCRLETLLLQVGYDKELPVKTREGVSVRISLETRTQDGVTENRLSKGMRCF